MICSCAALSEKGEGGRLGKGRAAAAAGVALRAVPYLVPGANWDPACPFGAASATFTLLRAAPALRATQLRRRAAAPPTL